MSLTAPWTAGTLLGLATRGDHAVGITFRLQRHGKRGNAASDGWKADASFGNLLRCSYARSFRRRQGGWRRYSMSWPGSSVEDLCTEAGRSVQAHAANPGATLANLCSLEPTLRHPTTAAPTQCCPRLREAQHASEMTLQRPISDGLHHLSVPWHPGGANQGMLHPEAPQRTYLRLLATTPVGEGVMAGHGLESLGRVQQC